MSSLPQTTATAPLPPRPLDAVVLAQLAQEWQHILTGAVLQKIHHRSHRAWAFTFRLYKTAAEHYPTLARQQTLLVSLHKGYPCIALLPATTNLDAFSPSVFAKPTNHVLLFRKHLAGGRITHVAAHPGERIVTLTIDNRNELGHPTQWQLVVELTGKHSNLMLVDATNTTITSCAHNVTETMSQHRQIAAGLPYTPPPTPPNALWLGQATLEDIAYQLTQWRTQPSHKPWHTLYGAGKHTWQDALALITHHGASPNQAAQHLYHWCHATAAATLPPPQCQWAAPASIFSLQPATGTLSGEHWTTTHGTFTVAVLTHQQVTQHQQRLLTVVQRQQDRLTERTQQQQGHTLASTTPPDTYQHWGDVLMTHASQHGPTTHPTNDTLTVDDWHTGQPLTLPVDTAKSWHDNAQHYYQQARRHKDRLARWDTVKAELNQRQALLNQLSWATQQATTLAELASIEADFVGLSLLADNKATLQPNTSGKRNNKSSAKKTGDAASIAGLLTFIASDGDTIIHVGRQGEANSALLSQLSKPTDWWCHAKDYPGAHVVIHHPDPPDEILLDGLHLACQYSGGATSGKLPIIYTQRRYVRKIPNSWPGHVTYTHETEAAITADEQRLAKLQHP